MTGDVTMIENVPVELNLGQSEKVVGLADLSKDIGSGRITIEITIFESDVIKKLEDFVDIFEIKAIGFAGIKRGPEDGR
jgi:hypothetical protein